MAEIQEEIQGLQAERATLLSQLEKVELALTKAQTRRVSGRPALHPLANAMQHAERGINWEDNDMEPSDDAPCTCRILLTSTLLQADLEEERNVNEEGSNFTMEALQHQVSHVSSCMYLGLNASSEPDPFHVLSSSAFPGSVPGQPPDRAL